MKDADVGGPRVNHLYGPPGSAVAPPKLGLQNQRPQQTVVNHLYRSTGANLASRGEELSNLRRQQAAFHEVRAGLDLQNSWMALFAYRGIRTPEGVRRPDVQAPARDPQNPDLRYLMELKPDTPSGRRAAARAVEEYERLTKNKTRPLFYAPKNFQDFK